MRLPLQLKWLGAETAEACALLAPYHPLIHVSPAPPLKVPPGLTPLPYRVSRLLDLRDLPAGARAADVRDAGGREGPSFEVGRLEYSSRELAAVYDFYFDVYLRHMALDYPRGQALYTHAERLHAEVLGRRFVAFARARLGRRAAAGCLLRRLDAADLGRGEGPADVSTGDGAEAAGRHGEKSAAPDEGNVVGLALFAVHPEFRGRGLDRLTLEGAARWARREGYSFMLAATEPGLVVDGEGEDASWLDGWTTTALAHGGAGALLYCDLERCCQLARDFYYYSREDGGPRLHYVANAAPETSRAVRFLGSLAGLRKLAHTRHAQTWVELARAGVECELLN